MAYQFICGGNVTWLYMIWVCVDDLLRRYVHYRMNPPSEWGILWEGWWSHCIEKLRSRMAPHAEGESMTMCR